jgi:hypothetical protein
VTISEFNFSAHSPQFVGGPLDGSAFNLPPTAEAVEMRCGRIVCRYKRADSNTFLFVESWPNDAKEVGE